MATKRQTATKRHAPTRAKSQRRAELQAVHTGWSEAEELGRRPREIIDALTMRVIGLEAVLIPYAAIAGPGGKAARAALRGMHPLTLEIGDAAPERTAAQQLARASRRRRVR